MEHNANPGPGKPGPEDANDAAQRLADSVDDETWLTLRAAIGQLSGIHDPDVLAHEDPR